MEEKLKRMWNYDVIDRQLNETKDLLLEASAA
jgi:hypothetical protein